MSTKDSIKTKAPAKQKKTSTNSTKLKAVSPSRDEIAQLAERFWMERGRSDGSAEQDWLRAERELVGTAS